MSFLMKKTAIHIWYEYYLFLESLDIKTIPRVWGNTYVCGRTIILGNLL